MESQILYVALIGTTLPGSGIFFIVFSINIRSRWDLRCAVSLIVTLSKIGKIHYRDNQNDPVDERSTRRIDKSP